jgi:hypothetical protein
MPLPGVVSDSLTGYVYSSPVTLLPEPRLGHTDQALLLVDLLLVPNLAEGRLAGVNFSIT